MPNIGPTEIFRAFLMTLLTFTLWGMVLGWGWLIWRLIAGQPILPEHPVVKRGDPPWRAGTVFVVFLTYVVVSFIFSIGYSLHADDPPGEPVDRPATRPAVDESGRKPTTEPPPRQIADKNGAPVSAKAEEKAPAQSAPATPSSAFASGRKNDLGAKTPRDEKKNSLTQLTQMMLLNAVVEIVMLLLVPVVVRLTCGGRLRDFGLSFDDWPRQAAMGIVATLIAAPPVYAIQFLAVRIWKPNAHPVAELISTELSMRVGLLAFVTAAILAPMFEELVFRGLLQNWLVILVNRRRHRAPVTPAHKSDIMASNIENATTDTWEPKPEPPLFSALPDHPQDRACPAAHGPDNAWLAIVLTSLLFAYVHAPQWPAPIPLFALAVIIGTMYYRTGSLITAVFMHATFNGISTLILFLTVLSGEKAIEDKVPAPAVIVQPLHVIVRPLHVKLGKGQPPVAPYQNRLRQKVKSIWFFLDGRESDC